MDLRQRQHQREVPAGRMPSVIAENCDSLKRTPASAGVLCSARATGRLTPRMLPRLVLLLALLATVGAYWTGLNGPFLFDDPSNLEPVRLWLTGKLLLAEVILPQPSLIYSRPVSMASFVLNALVFGDSGFGFKLGNLLVHLACGVLGYAMLRRALRLDARLAPQAGLLAALAAAIWLLHPLHVSTVLYAVQRMAQLSALFTLAAVWVFLVARQHLADGRTRAALLHLFLSFPLLVVLGVLSKQNAAAAPAICLALELAYFSKNTRPGATVRNFFAVFLVLPALVVAGILLLAPQKLLASYDEWDFTLGERLLTQARVLVDYMGMLLWPRGPQMGLYTDDFATSHGLFSPPSTLLCILVLVGISVLAVVVRKRAPSVFAGWFFFLAAHTVESGFLPLELYYEHRNYLPAFGLFLGAAGLLALVPEFKTNVLAPRKLGLLAVGGLALVLALATHGRALVWRDIATIAQLGAVNHPDSMRAQFDVSYWALWRKDYPTAIAAMNRLLASDNPRNRQMGQLSLVAINCARGESADSPALLQQAASANLPRLTVYESQAFGRLQMISDAHDCRPLKRSEITEALQRILDSARSQPEKASPKYAARYYLANLYASDGQWQAARKNIELAWDGGRDLKIGAFLAKVCLHEGDLECMQQVIGELERIVRPYEKLGMAELTDLKQLLAEERSKAQPK